MKKLILPISALLLLAGALLYRSTIREREVVILSTNDIHAVIDNFPKLVTAVNLCRDTVATLLVDSGDRWTGNAFIDRAEGRLPIIELMNHAGYNAATLGNHEFDKGAALLQGAIDYATFPIVCANMVSNRSDLTTPQSSIVTETSNGIKILITGVVTNYDNGHPDGSEEVFKGLEFSDPMDAATNELKKQSGADINILLSHMGDDKDITYASDKCGFHLIAGGHTHAVADTIVCNTAIGQTGRRLNLLGATHIRLRGKKVISAEYRNISLDDYNDDSTTANLVTRIENDPILGAKVGELANEVTRAGFANMMARSVADATNSQIGFYHYGGIRLTHHAAGAIKLATIYNLEPFASRIHTITMTPAQMRTMIITKYNDTKNTKESHRVDLFCTTPYQIIVDNQGEAIDVIFPKLRENNKYKVAMADYIGKKYEAICGDNHTIHNILVTDQLLKLFQNQEKVAVDNNFHQKIVKK